MIRTRLMTCLMVFVEMYSIGVAQEVNDFHRVTFVKIPLGKCLVGATPGTDAAEDEFPQHECRLTKPIWMSQTEITVAQFRTFAESTGYTTTNERLKAYGTWRSDSVIEELNTPVRHLTWHDARSYCDWLSQQCEMTCRLPTEHEWEYACRGGAKTTYPFGNDENDLSKYAVVSPGTSISSVPLPVKSRPANGFGLYGMLGNVSEYCLDSIGKYPATPVDAHVANHAGRNKIYRGGAFVKPAEVATCSYRSDVDPSYSVGFVGIRVVIEADE